VSFTRDELNMLLALNANSYLRKSADEKYNDFRTKDPFPNTANALLNSKDIAKYVLTTGLIDGFEPERLRGATYTCSFSGAYLYWNGKDFKKNILNGDGKPLIIAPNSITYLEIEQEFKIPEYMVLRFNLLVHHVYKGLLLGTGPVVDPGFVGKLYIPLHNFTTNTYEIKKGAALIDVEFTKLSEGKEWELKAATALSKTVKALDFSSLTYIPKEIKANRTLDEYIQRALQGDGSFKKSDDIVIVSSSVYDLELKMKAAKEQIDEADKNVEKNLEKTKNRVMVLSWTGGIAVAVMIITLLVLVFTLLIPTWQLVNDVNREYRENYAQLQRQIDDLTEQKGLLQDELYKLRGDGETSQDRIYTLEQQIIDLLNELEYLRGAAGGGGGSG